jgi:hypothetical protein
VCYASFHSPMKVSNIPVLSCSGSCVWVVKSDSDENPTSIIHLDAVVRTSHLLPIFGNESVPRTLAFTDTLNTFTRFYVNKYIDHHAFEIAF